MRSSASYGEIVRTSSGRGEITFPHGGRIQCTFTLTEYVTGKGILACTGEFTQASYRPWVQLVHRYRIESRHPLADAQQQGLTVSFRGQTAENQPVSLSQMVLIRAEASGVALLHKNVTLQMFFEYQDPALE
jgi:hypothetical protein